MPPRPCRAVLALTAAAAMQLAAPRPAAATTAPDAEKPDPKASKPEKPAAKSAKTGAAPDATTRKSAKPEASKSRSDTPDPKASKTESETPAAKSTRPGAVPDTKASTAPTPDPKAEPDPKASKPKSEASDSKASKSKSEPDPKASKPKSEASDPKASKPKSEASDPKASKPKSEASDSKTSKSKSEPDPKASKPKSEASDSKASKSKSEPDPKASKPKSEASDSKASKSKSEPDPKTSKSKSDPAPDPKASKPAPAPLAVPAAPALGDGYWLSAELLGAPESQSAARRTLAADLLAEPGAPGTLGRAATLPEAIQWVARWVFSGAALPPLAREPADAPLHEGDAPRPGGTLHADHRVVLHALTVTGRSSDGGTRPIRWPQTAAEIVPPGLAWVSAVLLAERAPLFAAPAAHVPPASERHALVRRSGSLFILGFVDRCTATSGERVCLRWAQVVARDGDSFRGGYLPAYQVARVDGWIRGAGQNPRAQLLTAGSVGARAQFVLVARARDGHLHRRTLLAPMRGDAYPAARLRVDGEWATIDFAGSTAQRIALDPSMDARVR